MASLKEASPSQASRRPTGRSAPPAAAAAPAAAPAADAAAAPRSSPPHRRPLALVQLHAERELMARAEATGSSAETGTPGRALQTGKADLRERKLVAQTCPANCGGSAHGRCVGRSCVCKSGWSGLDCTVESLLKKRCRKLRKAIKRVVNAKKRKKRNKRNRKLAKKRANLQQKGITDATCGLTCVDGTTCVDECGVAVGDGLTCADECGVPNGDDSTCADECGVPLGDGSTCR